nr:retrotransposon protein, putative, unclassified [Tanacetum cinerariifolium]
MTKNVTNYEPKKVIQALIDPSWIEAMQDELLQFKLQQVWTLVDLPYGKRAIGTKWIYKNKKDEKGSVVRNKARLVAQGYTQEERIYNDEIFALVARIEAIRKIEEEVYVCQPLGFEDPEFPDRVYKVEKALYGLDQAPKAWYETLSTYLLDNGFHKGELTFLGLQVTQKDDEIFTSQDKYVDKLLKKFGFSTVKIASTPMETSKPLLKDENAKDVDVYLYRSMIGSLMYLTSSRPDICLIYLKGQPKLGLWYLKDVPFNLEAYTNSDYASVSLDRKSTTREKPTESEGFEQIIDFLNANPIKYALTVNPTIYTSCIKQFRATTKVNTITGEEQIQALVDKKKVIITETSVRSNLQLENDEGGVKFLMFPRFVQVFLDKQVDGKDFSVRVTPLFPTMIVQAHKELDEAVYEEMYDSVERAATTTTGLDAEQDRGIISKTQFTATLNEPSSIGTSSGSRPMRQETIGDVATQTRVLALETAKTNQALEIGSLKRRTQGRNDQDMFDTGSFDDEEVSTIDPVTTAGVKVSAAATTLTISMDVITLAKALAALKSAKPMIKEPSVPVSGFSISPKSLKDKGKSKMIEPEKPLKKKDQIMIDEEFARNIEAQLQDELEEEDSLARQKEKKPT